MVKLIELELPFSNYKELEIWPKSLADIGGWSFTLILTMKISSVVYGRSNYWNQMNFFVLFSYFYLIPKFLLWLGLVNYGWLSNFHPIFKVKLILKS